MQFPGWFPVLILSLLVEWMQGLALTRVPKIKFLIIISGAKFGGSRFGLPPIAANAFSSPIQCPSLHFICDTSYSRDIHIDSNYDVFLALNWHFLGTVLFRVGETDFLNSDGIALLDSFVEPVVIHHAKGHTIPRLGECHFMLVIYLMRHLSVYEDRKPIHFFVLCRWSERGDSAPFHREDHRRLIIQRLSPWRRLADLPWERGNRVDLLYSVCYLRNESDCYHPLE